MDKNTRKGLCDKYVKVYIVLTQTNTYPARMIRLYTKEPFSHVSISLKEDLSEMYSFARRGIYNPLNAGFVVEKINSGVLARKYLTTCNIYEVKTTREKYDRLRIKINNFKSNECLYSYNFLGLLGVMTNIPIDGGNRFFCSQFVSYLLSDSEILEFDKECALVTPKDFRIHSDLNLIYNGRLKSYIKNNSETLLYAN